MPKLIITMCGTSALFFEYSNWENGFNGKRWVKKENLIARLEQEANNGNSNEYNHQKEQSIKILTNNFGRYKINNCQGLNTLSAELASLLAMQKDSKIGEIKKESNKNKDEIILLHSDTAEGKLCAEINKELFGICFSEINSKIFPIKGLNTKKADDFVSIGLNELLSKIWEIKDNNNCADCYLNITGGYKGSIPVLSILAKEMKIPIVYLFENCNEIIRMYIDNENKITCSYTNTQSGETKTEILDWGHSYCDG